MFGAHLSKRTELGKSLKLYFRPQIPQRFVELLLRNTRTDWIIFCEFWKHQMLKYNHAPLLPFFIFFIYSVLTSCENKQEYLLKHLPSLCKNSGKTLMCFAADFFYIPRMGKSYKVFHSYCIICLNVGILRTGVQYTNDFRFLQLETINPWYSSQKIWESTLKSTSSVPTCNHHIKFLH